MRRVVPYKTFDGALKALDNGGRFYNIFADASDDKVGFSELARVAGVYASFSEAFLHFELAISDLPPKARRRLVAHFSDFLKAMYRGNKPKVMLPSRIERYGRAGNSAIVTGFTRHIENREELTAMIMIPISTGDSMTFSMIPVFDQFDIYEVFDNGKLLPPRTLIATSRGSKKLNGDEVRFGGFLKELTFDDPTSKGHGLFLETLYYAK